MSKTLVSEMGLNSEVAHQPLRPQNFEEKIVWYGIIGTYVMYFTGTQYLAVPILAWVLFLYILNKLFLHPSSKEGDSSIFIPVGVWIWMLSTVVIGVTIVAAYYDRGYGLTSIIKALVNSFARKWMLLLIFPLVGCLDIRPKIIYRAVCILACQSLALLPIILLLRAAGFEAPFYANSLLARIGGLGDLFYSVYLYTEGEQRLIMFAPWAPALALIANVHLWIAYSESNKVLKWTSIVTCAILIQMSESRLGTLMLVSLPFVRYFSINILKPRAQVTLALVSFAAGLFSFQAKKLFEDFKANFRGQRSDSSRVRDILESMSAERAKDYPIWGHGFLLPEGPQIVAEMPIGSHHTWYGMLYAHGIVGFVALFIALAYTAAELFVRAQFCQIAQTALMIMFVLIAFSFGENLEGLSYLYWPGLVLFGIALKQP